MLTQLTLLERLGNCLDKLVEIGNLFDGLIPATLELDGMRMPSKLPPAIEGQREGDRSYPGCNLMHDHPLLKLLSQFGTILDRPGYCRLSDRYINHFAVNCTETGSGLFPWGEHAFWNFVDNRPGNSYILSRARCPLVHDHLNQAPFWLWEQLWECNPKCVIHFASGLDRHWIDEDRTEYSRHAHLFREERYQNYMGKCCDFPRHSGFYISDLAFAYVKTGEPSLGDQLNRFLRHWWDRRLKTGMLTGVSRSIQKDPLFRANVIQTLSLTVSLLETAQFLKDHQQSELAEDLANKAGTYLQAIIAAPHDCQNGRFVTSYSLEDAGDICYTVVWGSRYGGGNSIASSQALLLMAAYRLTEQQELLEMAATLAQYTVATTIPEDVNIPARDFGTIIELLCDLCELTGDKVWSDKLVGLVDQATQRYFDRLLPRGATGIDWYESQLGTGYLLHAMGRAAIRLNGNLTGRITPNYTLR